MKKKRDFGDGFYLGYKKKQTIALVNSCPKAKLYEIKIPIISLNTDNTLRKGKYISELFNDILMGKITEPTMDYTDYRNIEFDSPIHDERNDDNEYSFY